MKSLILAVLVTATLVGCGKSNQSATASGAVQAFSCADESTLVPTMTYTLTTPPTFTESTETVTLSYSHVEGSSADECSVAPMTGVSNVTCANGQVSFTFLQTLTNSPDGQPTHTFPIVHTMTCGPY